MAQHEREESPHDQDSVQMHLESYAYKNGDPAVNAPLIQHMKDEHVEAHARWALGSTIGDVEDQHYIVHGELGSEEELAREIEADNRREEIPTSQCPRLPECGCPAYSPDACYLLDASVARHPAGKKRQS